MRETLDGAVCPHPDCAPPRNPNFTPLDQIDELAMACGLRQVDELVHFSGTGPTPTPRNGAARRQVTSRRTHTFLCVFQKGGRR